MLLLLLLFTKLRGASKWVKTQAKEVIFSGAGVEGGGVLKRGEANISKGAAYSCAPDASEMLPNASAPPSHL